MDYEIPGEWARLSARQRTLIVTLDRRGSSSGAALAEGNPFGVEKPTIYRDLKKLRDDGYVGTEPRNDREYEYSLSRKGRELLADAREWMCA